MIEIAVFLLTGSITFVLILLKVKHRAAISSPSNKISAALVTPIPGKTRRLELPFDDIPLPFDEQFGQIDCHKLKETLVGILVYKCAHAYKGKIAEPFRQELLDGPAIDHEKLQQHLYLDLHLSEISLLQLEKQSSHTRERLEQEFSEYLTETSDRWLEFSLCQQFKWSVRLFPNSRVNDKTFHLRFKIPPAVQGDCQIVLKTQLKSRLRYSQNCYFLGNLIDSTQALALSQPDATFELGPFPWCDLQLPKQLLPYGLTFRLSPTHAVDQVATLALLSIDCDKGQLPEVLLVCKDQETSIFPMQQYPIPLDHDEPTTSLFIQLQHQQVPICLAELVLLNPQMVPAGLPDVETITTDFRDMGFDRFIHFLICQIYLASKKIKAPFTPLSLSDDSLRDLIQASPGSHKALQDNFHYHIKIVMSEALLEEFKNQAQDAFFSKALVDRIISTIKSDEYKPYFGEAGLQALLPSKSSPGLDIQVFGLDLPSDQLLLRTSPFMTLDPRGKIYGELDFSQWGNMRDLSGFSYHPTKTFLVPYPKNQISIRISKWPLYGLCSREVEGQITLTLENPESPDAVLRIYNETRRSIHIDSLELKQSRSHKLTIQSGVNNRFELEVSGQKLTIFIYPTPQTQLEQPFFIHEAAVLQFKGFTLDRRLDLIDFRSYPSFQDPADGTVHSATLGIADPFHDGCLYTQEESNGTVNLYYLGQPGHMVDNRPLGTTQPSLLNHENSILALDSLGSSSLVQYRKIDFHKRPQPRYLDLLMRNYTDEFADILVGHFKHYYLEVELLYCHPSYPADHLHAAYSVQDFHDPDRFWVFLFAGDPCFFYEDPHQDQPLLLQPYLDGKLYGPFPINRHLEIQFDTKNRHYINFQIPTHREQINTYLADGFYYFDATHNFGSFNKSRTYAAPRIELSSIVLENTPFIGKELLFQENRNARSSVSSLRFSPNLLYSGFDKDAYSIRFSPEIKGFVFCSKLHLTRGVKPKSIFMLLPEGGRPILGSHALHEVEIPGKKCTILLPGLAFDFVIGNDYYNRNV